MSNLVNGDAGSCVSCHEALHMSFGKPVDSVCLHENPNAPNSRRMHLRCMIKYFDTAHANKTTPKCPDCHEPLHLQTLIVISTYILARNRACKSTPNATLRICPFILDGYVCDKDLEFANKISKAVKRPDDSKIQLLVDSILFYTNDIAPS